MAKKKLKEVVETKTEDGKDIKLDIRYPSGKDYQEAQIEYSAEWARLINNEDKSKRVKTKKQIEDMLEENGIWTQKDKDKQKAVEDEIVNLGKQLKLGKTDSGRKMTKSEGRALAIKIHDKRLELARFTADRRAYDIHSAEGMAENRRFDYLMTVCVLDNEDGKPYFANFEDYDKRKDEKAAWDAARKLAEMVYGGGEIDFSENFENNVLEIQFLKKFNYIDDKGNYIDPKTNERVDVDGKPLKKEEIDTDIYGNEIKDGKAIVEFDGYDEDDEPAAPAPKKVDEVKSQIDNLSNVKKEQT
jgi:hypothetical protein